MNLGPKILIFEPKVFIFDFKMFLFGPEMIILEKTTFEPKIDSKMI